MNKYHLVVKYNYSTDWCSRFMVFLNDLHINGYDVSDEGYIVLSNDDVPLIEDIANKNHIIINIVKL